MKTAASGQTPNGLSGDWERSILQLTVAGCVLLRRNIAFQGQRSETCDDPGDACQGQAGTAARSAGRRIKTPSGWGRVAIRSAPHPRPRARARTTLPNHSYRPTDRTPLGLTDILVPGRRGYDWSEVSRYSRTRSVVHVGTPVPKKS